MNRAPICDERARHAAHGPAAERGVAREGGGEPVAGEEAQQEAGVVPELPQSRIARRSAKPAPAQRPDNGALAKRRDLGAELPEHPGRGTRVERRERAADVAGAASQRGEEQRTMGDALVARHADHAGDSHRSMLSRKRWAVVRYSRKPSTSPAATSRRSSASCASVAASASPIASRL